MYYSGLSVQVLMFNSFQTCISSTAPKYPVLSWLSTV